MYNQFNPAAAGWTYQGRNDQSKVDFWQKDTGEKMDYYYSKPAIGCEAWGWPWVAARVPNLPAPAAAATAAAGLARRPAFSQPKPVPVPPSTEPLHPTVPCPALQPLAR